MSNPNLENVNISMPIPKDQITVMQMTMLDMHKKMNSFIIQTEEFN